MAHALVRLVTFILLFTILFVCVDINVSGGLEASKTGVFLKKQGWLIYVKPYYSKLEQQFQFARTYVIRNLPSYDDIKRSTTKLYSHAVGLVAFVDEKIVKVYVLPYIPPDLSHSIQKLIMNIFYVIIEVLYYIAECINEMFDTFLKFMLKNNIIGENWKEQSIRNIDSFGKTAYNYVHKFNEWLYKHTLFYLEGLQ